MKMPLDDVRRPVGEWLSGGIVQGQRAEVRCPRSLDEEPPLISRYAGRRLEMAKLVPMKIATPVLGGQTPAAHEFYEPLGPYTAKKMLICRGF
jgi:hypothetical protein